MLDAETSALWAEIRDAGVPRVDNSAPDDARAAMRARQAGNPPGPELRRVTDVGIERDAGVTLDARVYFPDDPRGVMVLCHGGGWVLGDIEGFDHYARRLSHRLRLVVVSPEYRLAPEHPFPAAVDDAWSTLEWARKEFGGQLPLLVGGESAGANLAAVMAQDAAHAGIELAGQMLIYPVIDARLDRPSYREAANQLLVDGPLMRWFWEQYVPDARDRLNPRASPILGALSGLAAAIVVTAEHDPLRDEGEEYAARLADAGVAVQSKRFPGQMHGFATIPALSQSHALIDFLAEAVSKLLPLRVELSHPSQSD